MVDQPIFQRLNEAKLVNGPAVKCLCLAQQMLPHSHNSCSSCNAQCARIMIKDNKKITNRQHHMPLYHTHPHRQHHNTVSHEQPSVTPGLLRKEAVCSKIELKQKVRHRLGPAPHVTTRH